MLSSANGHLFGHGFFAVPPSRPRPHRRPNCPRSS